MAVRVYPGTIVSVHDGDSCTADLSLGFGLTYRTALRLDGINARELAQPGGPEARDHLRTLLPVGTAVTVAVVGVDKYGGRADALVAAPTVGDVSRRMIADGYAAAWPDGKGPAPVPPWPISE